VLAIKDNTRKYLVNSLESAYPLFSAHSTIIVDILKTSREALLASNAMKSSAIKSETVNWTNKLPGTKYSTSESLGLG